MKVQFGLKDSYKMLNDGIRYSYRIREQNEAGLMVGLSLFVAFFFLAAFVYLK